MHDDDEPLTEYEDRLRHALQRIPTPESDPDDVLARVEHGVRVRVRRRRVGAAGLGVAAVLAAAAVVVPTYYDSGDENVADDPSGHQGQTDRLHSSHDKTAASAEAEERRGDLETPDELSKQTAGKVTDPSGLSVSAIATNDSGAVSLIGESICPDGPCVVTGSPTGSTGYRIAPTDDRLLEARTWRTSTTVNDAPGIQVGADPSNSWAWTDAFYSTHDSGKTWEAVDLPTSLVVEDVQSSNGRVWAFGERSDGRPAVASSAEHSDNWVTEPVPVRADESIETPMVVADRLAFVASRPDSARAELVSQTAGGWDRRGVPCPNPVKSTTARDTVWLGCRTPNGSDYLAWSRDRGVDWSYEVVNRTGLSAVGGVDGDTAVAAAGDDLLVVDADGTPRKASTPYDASDDVWDGEAAYNSIRMGSDGTGYATTNGGALARTDDGGHTWKAQFLP
ncbi:MAG: hypothetical protein ACRDO7_08680 [Nocardioidaceae bacterium]